MQRAVVLSLQGFCDSGTLDEVVAVREPAPDEVVLHREKVGYLYDAVDRPPGPSQDRRAALLLRGAPDGEIATELGVSESRVSQMRAEALALLKDGLNAQLEPTLVSQHDRPNGCAARRRDAYFAEVAARSDYRTRLSAKVPAYASTAYARVASA